jgi:putative tryptophan/tyrosine transport system substrate-binding protein
VDRRAFISGITVSLLAAPRAAEAQSMGKIARIGYLTTAESADPSMNKAFRQGLRDLGYVEGRNVVIESRSAHGKAERLPGLAAELAALRVDVVVAVTNPAIAAAKQATATLPIVMVVAVEPVSAGFVASLAHPGGNITGLTFDVTEDTWAKRMSLLKETVPKVSRVLVFWNPDYPPNRARWTTIEGAGRTLNVTLLSAEIQGISDVAKGFVTASENRAGALFVLGDPLLFSFRADIASLAVKHGLPSISPYREAAVAGGVMAYGASLPDQLRRAAAYVDKILKGSKPADLLVEQPTTFELVINLKTAKALGLQIPQSLLLRADQVIA